MAWSEGDFDAELVLDVGGHPRLAPPPDAPISKLSTYYADHHAQLGRGGTLLGYSVAFIALFGVALWSRSGACRHPLL